MIEERKNKVITKLFSLSGQFRDDRFVDIVLNINDWESWSNKGPEIDSSTIDLVSRITLSGGSVDLVDVDDFFNIVQPWIPASHALSVLFAIAKRNPTALAIITKKINQSNSNTLSSRVFLSRLSAVASTELGQFIATSSNVTQRT